MTSNTNTLERERGILIVLSGPSGVGKGTVCAALRKMFTGYRLLGIGDNPFSSTR